MHNDQLKPKSLSITLAGEEHSATVRVEYVNGVFRMSTSENGVVTDSRDDESMLFAMEYASSCAGSGVTYLVPRSNRSDALKTAASELIDAMKDALDANQGPTN